MVGFARRTFMVPFPRARDFAELNSILEERCRERQDKILRGATATIGVRMVADQVAFGDFTHDTIRCLRQTAGLGHQTSPGPL